MGWNSWDAYGTTITEQEVLDNAQVMRNQLQPAGWDTIIIDAAWYDPTARAHGYNADAPIILDAYGLQQPDPIRFPSSRNGQGFKTLADRLHAMGLKFGLHVMRGIPRLAVHQNLPVPNSPYTARQIADTTHVCQWNPDNYGLNQNHPGAQAWYDAQTSMFAQWGIDYLKADDMMMPFYPKEIHAYQQAILKAEQRYGHRIILSLSPGRWLPTTHLGFLREHAQLWRISEDLWDQWDGVNAMFSRLARWAPYQTIGHWADADMLPLGRIGLRAERGDPRESRLTVDERKTMLTLWAMARSPLMMGGDLPSTDDTTMHLISNPNLREVTAGSQENREIIREPGHCFYHGDPDEHGEYIAWIARAADWADGTPTAHPGGHYLAMFWTGERPQECEVELQSIVGGDQAECGWRITDLWGDGNVNTAVKGRGADRVIHTVIPAHGAAWLAIDPQ